MSHSTASHFVRISRALLCAGAAATAMLSLPAMSEEAKPAKAKKVDIRDPYVKAWHDLTYDKKPPSPVPGVDYGMDPKTGAFVAPKATPLLENADGNIRFPGELTYWEQKSYSKNMEEMAFYQYVTSPHHTWQAIADFNGRRYMYVTDRRTMTIWDITDPRKAKKLDEYGGHWDNTGPVNPTGKEFAPQQTMGAVTIQWSAKLNCYVMVQSSEVQRFGIYEDKVTEPDGVDQLRHWKYNKGFSVWAMRGPLPEKWELLATRTSDYKHPDAPVGQQQGSGVLDLAEWFGGKYMFVAAAPDDSYGLTEYPNYLHSAGYQTWDMSDPRDPKFVAQFDVPGQQIGNKADEEAYLKNPRAGNRTSWMGARMSIFMPTPIEKGGKVGFAAMGGLGFYVLDMSDPANIKILSHLDFPPKLAGTEADNIDVSQYERTGYIFMNGYPMNDDCYEPYKDIMAIDVRDLKDPKVATVFPRPTPPAEAPFKDYCQRRGSFGPKRPGYFTQPGRSREGYVAYAFYNAGVQLFDVKDPANPKIAAYYVPRFPKDSEAVEYVKGNLGYGIYVEYDRNIIWMFTNHGFYALSSPLLGKPISGVPKKSWPPRD